MLSDGPIEEEKPLAKKKRGKRKRKPALSLVDSDLPEIDELIYSGVPTSLGTKKRKKKAKGRKHAEFASKTEAGSSLDKVARKAKKKTKRKQLESASMDESLCVPETFAEIDVEDGIDSKPAKKRKKVGKKRRHAKPDSSHGVLELPETISTTVEESNSPKDVNDSSSSLAADFHTATSQDDVEESTGFQVESSNETASFQEDCEIELQTVKSSAEPTDSSDQMNLANDNGLPDSATDPSYEALSIANEDSESATTVLNVSADSFLGNQTHEDEDATSHDSEYKEIKDTDGSDPNENGEELELTDESEFTRLHDGISEDGDADLFQHEVTNGHLDSTTTVAVDLQTTETSSTVSASWIIDENANDGTEGNSGNPNETADSSTPEAETPETGPDIDKDSNGPGEGDDTTSAVLVSIIELPNNSGNSIAFEKEDDSNDAKEEMINELEDKEVPAGDIQNEAITADEGNQDEDEGENNSVGSSEKENGDGVIDDQSNLQAGSTEDGLDQPNDAELSTRAESITGDVVEENSFDDQDSVEMDKVARIESTEGDERMVAESKDEDDNDDDEGPDGVKSESESAVDARIEEDLALPESTENEKTAVSSSDSQSTPITAQDTGVNQDTINIETIESFCDDPSDLICSIVTWNLAEESPAEEEAAFFKQFRGHDIVLISGQECENIKPRRAEGRRSREYRRLMIKYLGSEYVPIALHMLGGIQFGLFCKRSILNDVKLVSVADVTCGIGNVFHNKGAIAAFVTLQNKSPAQSLRLLFVTAHMAAHVKNTEARNSDFWRIVSELEEQVPAQFLAPRASDVECTGEYLLNSVDRIFFCGDLNYRIDLPRERVEHTVREAKKHEKVGPKALEKLLRHDQLRAVMAEGSAFPGFAEGQISFDPTFKYDKGTQDFDTSPKQRIPAWTDRVLFKPKGTRVLTYDSVPLASRSDHRPVFASFRVNRRSNSESKSKRRKRKR